MDLTELKSHINSLNGAQQKELTDWLLLQQRGTGASKAVEEELLLEVVNAVLKRRIGASPIPYHVARKSDSTVLRRGLETFHSFLALNQLASNRITDLQMASRLSEFVVDYLQDIQMVVSWKTVLQQFPNLAGIMDRSFPDYLRTESGRAFLKANLLKKTS